MSLCSVLHLSCLNTVLRCRGGQAVLAQPAPLPLGGPHLHVHVHVHVTRQCPDQGYGNVITYIHTYMTCIQLYSTYLLIVPPTLSY